MKLLFFVWCCALVPLLLVMVPLSSVLAPMAAHVPHAREVFSVDDTWIDIAAILQGSSRALSGVLALSLFVSVFLLPLVSGAIVASLRGERALLAAAMRDYGRQLRLSFFMLLPLALAAGLAAPGLIAADNFGDRAVTEHAANTALYAAIAAAVLFVLMALAWLDCMLCAMIEASDRPSAWQSFRRGTRIFRRAIFRKTFAEAAPIVLALVGAAFVLWLRNQTGVKILSEVVPVILAWQRIQRVAWVSGR